MSTILLSLLMTASCFFVQSVDQTAKIIYPLDSLSGLELINVKADVVDYNGKTGIQVAKGDGKIGGETLVLIRKSDFMNGIISVDLTGEPAVGADPQMRGFVGIAFRVNPSDYSSYECFYLRPTNARANEQIRRNHSTQYVSHPEFPWYRLRNENPGHYESYVDLIPGEWTHIKIEVNGKQAKLYLHNSEQPCLIVNDLKHGESEGMVALWLHSSTLARFRNLVINPVK